MLMPWQQMIQQEVGGLQKYLTQVEVMYVKT